MEKCVVCQEYGGSIPDICPSQCHEHVCVSCIQAYVDSKLDGMSRAVCAPMLCPSSHKGESYSPILNFSVWSKLVNHSFVAEYESRAKNSLTILCGNCHQLNSIQVDAVAPPQGKVASSYLMDGDGDGPSDRLFRSPEHQSEYERFRSEYLAGKKSIESFYCDVAARLAMVHDDPKITWSAMKTILSEIDNPERRCNLQLRHMRSHPIIRTTCCQQEHCFRCQAIGSHHPSQCSAQQYSLDESILPCPACAIPLTKGDGCDRVTCICRHSFSWSQELKNYEVLAVFRHMSEEEVVKQCVFLLCEGLGSDYTEVEAAASMLRGHLSEQIHQGMRVWWREQYGAYSSQVCSLHPPSYAPAVAWAEVWAHEVNDCIFANKVALRSIFETFHPNPRDRPKAAVRLIHFTQESVDKRLLLSTRMWAADHRDECFEAYKKIEVQRAVEVMRAACSRLSRLGKVSSLHIQLWRTTECELEELSYQERTMLTYMMDLLVNQRSEGVLQPSLSSRAEQWRGAMGRDANDDARFALVLHRALANPQQLRGVKVCWDAVFTALCFLRYNWRMNSYQDNQNPHSLFQNVETTSFSSYMSFRLHHGDYDSTMEEVD